MIRDMSTSAMTSSTRKEPESAHKKRKIFGGISAMIVYHLPYVSKRNSYDVRPIRKSELVKVFSLY